MKNTEHRTATANIQRSSAWGKSKVNTETKETLTCRSCKECRGYKFAQAEAGIILAAVSLKMKGDYI